MVIDDAHHIQSLIFFLIVLSLQFISSSNYLKFPEKNNCKSFFKFFKICFNKIKNLFYIRYFKNS